MTGTLSSSLALAGRRERRLDSRAGFTLLELLLATAVGAIVLLVINATFFAALRLHNATHEKIDADLVVERTLAIIRRDLAGLMLPPNAQSTTTTLVGQLVTDGATGSNDMDGTATRVTPDFYTSSGRIDGWTDFADVQMVSYYLAPAADGGPTKNLVRVVTRNLLAVNEPTTEDQTLLVGVRSADVTYYDGANWTDTWDSSSTSTLPTAIKFSIVLEPRDLANNGTNPGPIELVVPVLVTTTTSAQDAAAAATGQ